jgi:hypothetical protein
MLVAVRLYVQWNARIGDLVDGEHAFSLLEVRETFMSLLK